MATSGDVLLPLATSSPSCSHNVHGCAAEDFARREGLPWAKVGCAAAGWIFLCALPLLLAMQPDTPVLWRGRWLSGAPVEAAQSLWWSPGEWLLANKRRTQPPLSASLPASRPPDPPVTVAPPPGRSSGWKAGQWWSAGLGCGLLAALLLFCFSQRRALAVQSQRWSVNAVVSTADMVQAEAEHLHFAAQREARAAAAAAPPPPPLIWKKFLPLALMCFAGLFNYTLLSNTKDVLMVTAPRSGAEAIPFLKTYVNLPGAVLWTVTLTQLSNRMAQGRVFTTVVLTYLIFFLTFTLVLYPYRSVLHPEGLADRLAALLPPSFMAPIALLRYWTFSIFYVMAETWGSVVVSTILWGVANQICTVEEAKRYYPLLGFSGNVAPVLAGQYGQAVSALRGGIGAGDNWGTTLNWLTGGVMTCGTVMLACTWYLERRVLTDPTCVAPAQQRDFSQCTRLSVKESARLLVGSPYLRSLALLVICYGLSMNIVDTTWKSKLRAQYPDPNQYSAFMGAFSSATGVITLSMMVLSRHLLCHCGWGVSAAITPVALGITGLTFFSLLLFPSVWAPLATSFNTTPLMLAVLVGALQNGVSKSAKWALFDPCKNMAYIPLDPEARTKGKAAIDVIGGPLGKSGGAFLQQGLILGLGSLGAATPFLGVCLTAIIVGWLHAVRVVSRRFDTVAGAKTLDGN